MLVLHLATFQRTCWSFGQLRVKWLRQINLRRVLDSDADLLLLDEPTNNLDEQTARDIEHELYYRHGAILVVTHDRAVRVALRPELNWHINPVHRRVEVRGMAGI